MQVEYYYVIQYTSVCCIESRPHASSVKDEGREGKRWTSLSLNGCNNSNTYMYNNLKKGAE